MIIRKNSELKQQYHELCSNDVIIGIISSNHLKPYMLIDLIERGVRCFPSPLAQTLNSSKVAQALVFKKWMLPHTCVIKRRMDLIESINQYNKNNISAVVTKQDHLHCGFGVRKWETIESLYSFTAMSETSYPIVVQPFLENYIDVRIIIVGDYVDAYTRYNPNNFRMNIAAGGSSSPYDLDIEKEEFSRAVMKRGKFPYAHIDLMIADNNKYYLSEIALNGGVKGANINRQDLDQIKQDLLEKLATT
jgi:glutathione synthase/RimK-type ligase-like ATP-grasp enzyme